MLLKSLIISTTLILYCGLLIAQITFEKHFDFPGSNEDLSFKQTPDSGYILICSADSVGESIMIKTDPYGNMQWQKIFSGASAPQLNFIDLTDDGHYIVTGYQDFVNTKIYLGKYDTNGNLVWEKNYWHGGVGDIAFNVHQTSDGGYIITGFGQINFNSQVFVLKTNENGDSIWSTPWSANIYQFEAGYYAVEATDGGYIVTGRADEDAFLLKADASGTISWSKLYGDPIEQVDIAFCVQETFDGGYIIAGSRRVPDMFNFHAVMWLLKTDENGDTLWTKTFDYSASFTDQEARSVVQTADGGFVFTGAYTDSALVYHVCLIKTDAEGNEEWHTYLDAVTDTVQPRELQQTSDGGFAVIGLTGWPPHSSIYFAKTDGFGYISSANVVTTTVTPCQVYPNPFSDFGMLDMQKDHENMQGCSVDIFNQTGKLVRSYFDVNFPLRVERESLATGLYYFELKTSAGNIFHGNFIIAGHQP